MNYQSTDSYVLVTLTPESIATDLQNGAQDGANFGLVVGTTALALFLFVSFIGVVIAWFRAN